MKGKGDNNIAAIDTFNNFQIHCILQYVPVYITFMAKVK